MISEDKFIKLLKYLNCIRSYLIDSTSIIKVLLLTIQVFEVKTDL